MKLVRFWRSAFISASTYTHRQLLHDEAFLSEVLKDGIKIYGK